MNKPWTVKAAIYAYGAAVSLTMVTVGMLIYFVQGRDLSRVSFAMPPGSPVAGTVIMYIMMAVILAILAFLIVGLPIVFLYQVSRTRNWGRVGLLILTLLSLLFFSRSVTSSISAASLSWPNVVGTVSITLQVAAVVLLFLKVSNAWFRRAAP